MGAFGHIAGRPIDDLAGSGANRAASDGDADVNWPDAEELEVKDCSGILCGGGLNRFRYVD